MPNDYFQFVQFVVHQGSTAMKVCTDASLFGAWSAALVGKNQTDKPALDIGTGTGLLSLMLAQETGMLIDAIDIDGAAVAQARQNAAGSPFATQINVIEQNVLQWLPARQYDVVICNPPFFARSLLSQNAGKNLSKHETQLDLPGLLERVMLWLRPGGQFYLLLPFDRLAELQEAREKTGWSVARLATVRNVEMKRDFRIMVQLVATPSPIATESITIRQADGTYTPDFLERMRPFYLPLHYLRNIK